MNASKQESHHMDVSVRESWERLVSNLIIGIDKEAEKE